MPDTPSSSADPLGIAAVTSNLLVGGATTFLLNLERGLGPLPHFLRVVGLTEPTELAADFATLGTDLHSGSFEHLIYEDRLAWAAARVAEARPHALLACLGPQSYEMLRLAPSGVARIGLIQSDDPLPYAMAARYHPWIDAMVGVSEGIAGKLRAMPEFRGKTVAAIPYGIAFGAPVERVPCAGPLRVAYVGRLQEEQKRISRLAELIARLPGPEFHFTIAGGGPDEGQFASAVAGALNVTQLGPVPNTRIASLLAEQDVLVLLSDFEGLPLSLLEAMGRGVVPVVSDLPGGIREAVPPECGVRVPVGDVTASAAALRELAADRLRLAALSRAAVERTRRLFSAERMAREYVALVRSFHPVAAEWPAIRIPTPIGLSPWLFNGPARLLRRACKKLLP